MSYSKLYKALEIIARDALTLDECKSAARATLALNPAPPQADAEGLLRELVECSDLCDELRDENKWTELQDAEERESRAWRAARAYLAAKDAP